MPASPRSTTSRPRTPGMLGHPLRTAMAALALAGTAVGTSQVVLAPTAMARYGSVVATAGVNVRSGPSTSSPIIGGLGVGESAVQVGAVTHGYVPVRWQGRTGYVAAAYVNGAGADSTTSSVGTTSTAHTSILYTTADVNVRMGPSLDATVSTVLTSGQQVHATGTTASGFTQVVFQGSTRWIYSQYLSRTHATTGTTTKVASRAVATADLMIRTSSDANFTSLGDIPAGTILNLTGRRENGVSQIIWQGQLRWVNSQFLTAVGTTVTVVTPSTPRAVATRYATTSLNIRSAASSDDSVVVDTVAAGTALRITGTFRGLFTQVLYQGSARWVWSQYLSSTKPSTTTSSSSKGAAVVAFAYAQLGKPYVWGATGPNSYDCSGLAQAAWASVGVSIPRVTYAQLSQLTPVAESDLQPGDIVGFYNGDHVGIYVGGGYVIHAPHTGDVVRKVPLNYMPYYMSVRP